MRARPNDLKPRAGVCRARDLRLLAHGVSFRAAVGAIRRSRRKCMIAGLASRFWTSSTTGPTGGDRRRAARAEQVRAASGIGTVLSAADFIDTAPHSTMGNLGGVDY